MICKFFLLKLKKYCIYIGPYGLAFNDTVVEDFEEDEYEI